MIWKCKKCGSESNESSVTAEWCETCEDMRVQVMPEKREYTSNLIFEKYLDDKCPVCDGRVDSDSQKSNTESGGKCMAKYFHCNNCHSEYTIGYERSSMPISSEITHNAVYS